MSESKTISARGDSWVVEPGEEPQHYRCPDCGNDFHINGLPNHMNHCPEWHPPAEEEAEEEVEEEAEPGAGFEPAADEAPPATGHPPTEATCPHCGNPDDDTAPRIYGIVSREKKTWLKQFIQEQDQWSPERDRAIEEYSAVCWGCGGLFNA